MPHDVLIGIQRGDEGKGKFTDILSDQADIVCRFLGGNNAGHTIILPAGQKVILHLIPSGILRDQTVCCIGPDVVLNPDVFQEEINSIGQLTWVKNVLGRIKISAQTKLIMPYHIALDGAREKTKGDGKIGTTKRGISPAYESAHHYTGLRFGDLFNENYFITQLKKDLYEVNILLAHYGQRLFTVKDILNLFPRKRLEFLQQFLMYNMPKYLNDALDPGKNILSEGAQGTILDNTHGTYPYVSSSQMLASNACSSLGIPVHKVDRIYGVFKAYMTHVGTGPFLTEIYDHRGELIGQIGNEFGATTGRKRRVGWLDLAQLRWAIMINGVTHLILTKLDVLQLAKIEIQVNNEYLLANGTRTTDYSSDQAHMLTATNEVIIPAFKDGDDPKIWHSNFINMIQPYLPVPIYMYSDGPERDNYTILT